MMPLPYSDVFSVFPEILREKNRDLKTSHDTYWGCHAHFFFSNNLYGNSCVRIHQIWIHCRDCGLLVLFFGLLWFFSYTSIFFIYMS